MNEDKATRYQRLRRRASLLSTCLTGTLLVALLVTGAASTLRDASAAVSGASPVVTAFLFVLAVTLLIELLTLPLTYYQGVTLERRYGLSTQSTARWWVDHAKATGLGLVAAVSAGMVVSVLLRWTPTLWWLLAASGFILVLIVLTQIAPVVLLPLFDAIEPLRQDALVRRLMALARRANTRVLGVFEWRLSARTRKANAALTGIGRTRRILISDTLLARHSDDEIEVILAHELAHHVHHDIWQSIVLDAALIVLSARAADVALAWGVSVLDLNGKADVAALPIVALAFGAMSLLFTPVANALSRAHERRADRYALEMTGNVDAFVSAMRRLGAHNLSDENPTRLVESVFYTHPSVSSRISAAQAWAADRR